MHQAPRSPSPRTASATKAAAAVAAMKPGDILCLENTRFHKGEEKNDPAFVAELAKLGDLWVNDAFSAAHRAHASTEGLGHKLPAYAGRTMQAELEALDKALGAPKRPVVAIVGGAKVSTKLDLLENLITKVAGPRDRRRHGQHLPAGAGHRTSASRWSRRTSPTPRGASWTRPKAQAAPSSCRSTPWSAFHFAANAPSHAYGVDAIPADGMMLDVGGQSIERIKGAMRRRRYPGLERAGRAPSSCSPFDKATVGAGRIRRGPRQGRQARFGGRRWRHCGGAAMPPACSAQFTYVSTAGGAFLEVDGGQTLAGRRGVEAKIDPERRHFGATDSADKSFRELSPDSHQGAAR